MERVEAPWGWFEIPENYADLTEAERTAWSRSVAEEIAAVAAEHEQG